MYRHHEHFISEFNFGAKNLLTWSNDKKNTTGAGNIIFRYESVIYSIHHQYDGVSYTYITV